MASWCEPRRPRKTAPTASTSGAAERHPSRVSAAPGTGANVADGCLPSELRCLAFIRDLFSAPDPKAAA